MTTGASYWERAGLVDEREAMWQAQKTLSDSLAAKHGAQTLTGGGGRPPDNSESDAAFADRLLEIHRQSGYANLMGRRGL